MKKYFTSIIFTLLIINANAQAPNFTWSKSAGGVGSEIVYKTVTDPFGNVFMAGTFTSPSITFGNIVLNSTSNLSMFIAKYDALGNVLWAKSANGDLEFFNDVIMDLATDALGNVYLMGNYSSPTISFGSLTLSGGLTFLVKYDQFGNEIWAKGETGYANNISTDNSGNLYLIGVFYNQSITIGSFTLTKADTTSAWPDIFIVKYNALGNVIWAKSEGSGGAEERLYIATNALGNVFITGVHGYFPTLTVGTFTLTNVGNSANGYDIFTIKYDSLGNVIWVKGAGGIDGNDGTLGIATDAADNVYITGDYYASSITFDTTILTNQDTSGGFDSFIAKYDASGNLQWAHGIGGTGGEFAQDISIDFSNDIYVTGVYSDSISFGATTLYNVNYGAFNIFIAKYDNLGNVIWATYAEGTDQDYGRSISTDPFGNVFVGGNYISSNLTFGTNTLLYQGGVDIFIAKLGNNLTEIEVKNSTNEINIYPNPSNGLFNFKDTKNLKQAEVYNILGEQILSQGNQKQINLSGFAKGIYYARINGEVVVKLVKE